MSACLFHDVEPSLRDRRLFDLVEEAYKKREKVVVFATTPRRAEAIDRLHWIHRQESFIPHAIFTGPESDSSIPVAIVTGEWNPIEAGTLVADCHCSLEFAWGFATIHEFVDGSSPGLKQVCRDRFRAYRSRQFTVEYSK